MSELNKVGFLLFSIFKKKKFGISKNAIDKSTPKIEKLVSLKLTFYYNQFTIQITTNSQLSGIEDSMLYNLAFQAISLCPLPGTVKIHKVMLK